MELMPLTFGAALDRLMAAFIDPADAHRQPRAMTRGQARTPPMFPPAVYCRVAPCRVATSRGRRHYGSAGRGQAGSEGGHQVPNGTSWRWASWPTADQVGRSAGRRVHRAQDLRPEPRSWRDGAGFLAIALIDFLRQVDAVIAAGRTGRQPAKQRN